MRGKIVRLVRDRGFGFIQGEDNREVFFHATGVKGISFDALSEGQTVEFDIQPDPRSGKQRAVDVNVPGSESEQWAS